MTPRKPPKKPPGPCPKGGDHVWDLGRKDGANVIHKCRRCPATYTRKLDPNRNAA